MTKTVPLKHLGDLCDVIGGGTPPKDKPSFYTGNILWATVRDMNVDVIDDTAFKITGAAVKACATNIIPPNNVVIASRVGLGKVCRTRYPTAINQDLRGIIPRNLNALSVDYLFWWFKSIADRIQKEGKGATVKGVTLPFIKSLEIPVPTLAEQKRIVAILDQAFEAIDIAKANAETNAQNARALFNSCLSQFLTTLRSESRKASVGELVAAGAIAKPQDGNHGEIHPTKADYVSKGVPFVMAADLTSGAVDTTSCRFISNKQARSLRIGFAKNGDVLLSHKGTIGRVAVLSTDLDFVVLTPQITYYRVLDSQVIDTRYLYYYLQSEPFQNELKRIAGAGSTRAYIGITRQLDLKILLPPIGKQLSLVEMLEGVEIGCASLTNIYKNKAATVAALKQSVLASAFSGDLRDAA